MDSRVKCLKNDEYEYCEKDKLGQGSFAVVYKGLITKNNRVVAIRLLPLKLIDQYGEKIKQIITGQVSVLKDLSLSESVDAIFTTRIFDCFITKNNVVMILEFCPDGSLEDMMKKGPLPENEALDVLFQLARGLQFIAREKVVHRDIKPDNIFIKKEGSHTIFKLGDFGFAVKKQLNHQIVGTPIFMSPELFREQKYGSEVDVWAYGLMAHYVLFKQYYFIGATEQHIKAKVLKEPYTLKGHHLKKISNQMADFLTQCLQLDKRKRMPATKISEHPVFDPIRNKVNMMIAEVKMHSSMMENQLSKKTVKGKVANEFSKYNFLVEFAKKLRQIDRFNLGSLYILKHSLGELGYLNDQMASKNNFMNCPDWNSFCQGQDYEKSAKFLKYLMKGCEEQFESTFNDIIPMVSNRYGNQVANGIQQNLGQGPFTRINPKIINHELQNNWYPRLQQNKTPETHLVALQLVLAMGIYEGKPVSFDFMAWELNKESMGLKECVDFIEGYLKTW